MGHPANCITLQRVCPILKDLQLARCPSNVTIELEACFSRTDIFENVVLLIIDTTESTYW